jgi:transposase InsO family protein
MPVVQLAYQSGVTLDFSRPGKPTDNGVIPPFNSHLRAECHLDQSPHYTELGVYIRYDLHTGVQPGGDGDVLRVPRAGIRVS